MMLNNMQCDVMLCSTFCYCSTFVIKSSKIYSLADYYVPIMHMNVQGEDLVLNRISQKSLYNIHFFIYIVTSANVVGQRLCIHLCVSSVCLLEGLLKKLWTDLDKMLWKGTPPTKDPIPLNFGGDPDS